MGDRINISGMKFGRLTAIECVGINKEKRAVWKCICDCGNVVNVAGKSLRTGNTKSCGCYSIEKSTERIVKLNTKHGGTHTKLYHIWSGMKDRCYYKKCINYNRYGGKGIKICEEWLNDFSKFRIWAENNGYNENLTIDRIDSNGDYCPENCRWATPRQQANNRSTNVILNCKGESHTAAEWERIVGLPKNMILSRIKSGIIQWKMQYSKRKTKLENLAEKITKKEYLN